MPAKRTLLTALASLAAVPAAPGALLLSPGQGVVHDFVASGTVDRNDGAFTGAYVYYNPPFFGAGIGLSDPAPLVSLNGSILFNEPGGYTDAAPYPLGMTPTSTISRIAPLWHDFKMGTTGRIIEHEGANFAYYGVTWENMESATIPGAYATFQAIFFEESATIQGNTFHAGDIAFSYGDVGIFLAGGEAAVGLEKGGSFATLAELIETGGVTSQVISDDFPVEENEFIRFRPNGAGSYTVSLLPIPEPTVAVLGGASALALLRRRRLD